MSFDVTTLALAKSYTNQHGGSGGSVPKPLTYDYMPEGYPRKSVGTVTLMEEQEFAFTLYKGFYVAQITNAFEIAVGQTYTVKWDGTEYECVSSLADTGPIIGNLSFAGIGDDTGEPFAYVYNTEQHSGMFATLDTSASHTISVKTTEEIVTPMAEEFLPDGVGGGGVQPDWNQNDSTAPDYVKNRPFYTGDPVETVFVEESTVSFSERNGIYQAVVPSTFKATVGETYKVSWDGTTYESTCVDFSGRTIIGNLSIMGSGSDTGEPFLIVVFNGERINIGTADTSASHTISISGVFQEVVKIDEKYLPKGLIVNIVGRESNSGNTYLLFDKTNEEIYNAANNGITVTLKTPGGNLQYIKDDTMFWGIVPKARGTNGITKLEVVYVSLASGGWLLKETYINASTDSNS